MEKSMKHRKMRVMAVLLLLALLGLTGCAGKKEDERVALTMYLWDRPMMQALTPWLEAQFPEIDFTFVVGYNTMDYYTDLSERGALPDILTCRRFSLNDAASMSGLLLDLSETEVVGSYYDSYIEYNREPDGAVRWLPMCAEVDGYIANADLFAQHGIPLPTNRAEFAQACRRFEALGLRGYVNDYYQDYSCMEALQGCAIDELMTLQGMQWRRAYESETADAPVGLDDTVWPAVFRRFAQYIQDTRIAPEDMGTNYTQMHDALVAGEIGIMRGTASNCAAISRESGVHTVMLPYFGDTAEDNWLLTYPIFQVAVNRAVEQDARKQDAVMRVLEAMLSEEGQRRAAVNNAVLSYNKNVNIQISSVFSQVKDCIDSNHLYMRLASTEMFAVSRDVVQRMIQGEYDAKEAYEAFDAQLIAGRETPAPQVVTTQKTAYAYLDGRGGSPAASAVLGTLRRAQGCEVAVGYAGMVSAPVFAGDYTAQQLSWLLSGRAFARCGTLTGEELRALMEWLVNVKADGVNPIRHRNLLPVTSGLAYTLTDQGDGAYALEELTIGGKPVSAAAQYTVLLLGDESFIELPDYINAPMPQALKDKLETAGQSAGAMLCGALDGGRQLVAPETYVTIRRK